ncbi:RluA family pseudouridine synthase [Candidatus Roizmanbacteria bacterium]|nr:RluA family pseudouridine synthase [Candidatus Roizmanbacteria bacterium]
MEPSILYEDSDMLVVDKPAGMVVNRASTVTAPTLEDWAASRLSAITSRSQGPRDPAIRVEFASRNGIVHRLDKDTSGVLVIAKHEAAFERLKQQFQDRTVAKQYIALVHGRMDAPVGTIHAPVGRLPWARTKFGVFAGGRDAKTLYEAKKGYRNPVTGKPLTLLTVKPHTGRTHQIRVHLRYINHPIVSDHLYGGRKQYQLDRQFCPRMFLHAEHLTCNQPTTGTLLTITSELAPDLQQVLSTLEVQ